MLAGQHATPWSLLATASRNGWDALLLDRTPADGDGPSLADPKDEARLLNNLLKMMYDWIDCNREFLFVKEPQEVVIYSNIIWEACVKVWNHKPDYNRDTHACIYHMGRTHGRSYR
ncbi:hypothetical protein MRX96_039532 [Rhipicephalus microplus]